MIVAGGIVTQKPIGIVSNNPNFAQQAAQREAAKQAQVDALAAKLAEKHQAQQAQQAQTADQQKKRTVKF
jgi:hypothetical protein